MQIKSKPCTVDGCIYKVTCTANGRFLIGSTSYFDKRKARYLYELRKGTWSNPILQAVFNKHGESSIKFEIIQDKVPRELLVYVEDIWIGALKSREDAGIGGMNIRDASTTRPSEKTKEKIRVSCKAASPHTKRVLYYDMFGKFVTSFRSTVDAGIYLNTDSSTIARACHKKTCKNFQVRYYNGNNIPESIERPDIATATNHVSGEVKQSYSILGLSRLVGISEMSVHRALKTCKTIKNWEFKFI